MEGGVARGVVEGEGIVAAPTQDGGPVSIVPGVDGVIAGTHVSDVVAADTGEGVVASPCVDGFSAIGVGDELITRGAAVIGVKEEVIGGAGLDRLFGPEALWICF